MAAALAQLGKHTILFRSIADFAKVCSAAALSGTVPTLQAITNKNTGYGTLIQIDRLDVELTDQPIEWFRERAQLYLNLRKGSKEKTLLYSLYGRPVFFANRKRFGNLCYQIAYYNDIGILNGDLGNYCEELETSPNGNLVAENITGFNLSNFHALFMKLAKVEAVKPASVEREQEELEREQKEENVETDTPNWESVETSVE